MMSAARNEDDATLVSVSSQDYVEDDEYAYPAEDESNVGLLSDNNASSSKFMFGLDSLFDVDTKDVMARIQAALLPRKSFFDDCIRNKPDMYGPLWISMTLVLVVAVASNIADYISQVQSQIGDQEQIVKFHWHYDFHKVSLAMSLVASYVVLVPLGLHGYLWYASSSENKDVGLLQLLCLYGYSLAIFVPISLLWLIQEMILQWLLVIVGVGLSGGVLALTLYPLFTRRVPKSAVVLVCIVILLHAFMASGFMIYFFHHRATATAVKSSTDTSINLKGSTPKSELTQGVTESKRSAENDQPLPLTKHLKEQDLDETNNKNGSTLSGNEARVAKTEANNNGSVNKEKIVTSDSKMKSQPTGTQDQKSANEEKNKTVEDENKKISETNDSKKAQTLPK